MYQVLIVDDEPIVKIALRSMLDWSTLGFHICATASNGQEALEMAEKYRPDLIICDLKMPVMDGLEATRKIKAVNPTLPVIAVTAYAYDHDREKALQAGCNDYMTKPMDVTELKQKLSEFVKDKH